MPNTNFERLWAWPTRFPTSKPLGKNAGTIGIIFRIVKEIVGNGVGWLDPMCGRSDICEFRNDIRSARTKALTNMDALDYLRSVRSESIRGVVYDPPYNDRQGYKYTKEHHSRSDLRYWADIRSEISRILIPMGKLITLGWHSNEFPNCKITAVKLFAHGSERNDTILTIQKKNDKFDKNQ